MGIYNPIRSVDGNTNIPAPMEYEWVEQDISGKSTGNEKAGRNEAYTMKKKRKGQLRALNLIWGPLSIAECAALLQAFDPEYFDVEHLDAKAGGWITRKFYVGDKSVPAYNIALGLWRNVSFKIVRVEARMDRLHL